MDLSILLKALPIFAIVSNIAATWPQNRTMAVQQVIVAVEKEIDDLIFKGHLPADFKNNLGNLVPQVVAIHPDVPIAPAP